MKRFLFIGLFLLLASPCLAEMISVTHQPAELRDRAMVSGSTIIRELPRYTPLEILNTSADYFQVKDADGTTGYIHKSLTGETPAIVVTGGICNLRSAPGTEFPVVFKAYKGDSYKVISQEQDWLQITTEDKKTAWIREDLVWGD
jgi:uncharacterized protein YgiM (DUF1202 family)